MFDWQNTNATTSTIVVYILEGLEGNKSYSSRSNNYVATSVGV